MRLREGMQLLQDETLALSCRPHVQAALRCPVLVWRKGIRSGFVVRAMVECKGEAAGQAVGSSSAEKHRGKTHMP